MKDSSRRFMMKTLKSNIGGSIPATRRLAYARGARASVLCKGCDQW
jgi:hypothetical protein